MKQRQIRVIVTGALGRTGSEVTSSLAGDHISFASIVCGVDVRAKADEKLFGVPIYADFSAITERADALIDFSSAEGVATRLEFAAAHGLCAVLAPTGFSAEDEKLIGDYAERIAIFRAANFSLGAAVTEELCLRAKRLLPDFETAIIEKHHKTKKDAPSGTALRLAAAIDGTATGKTAIYPLRLGTFPGEHEIIFAGDGESVTMIHRAENRRIFALGAIKAAGFLFGKPAGLYGMKDMMKELF